MTRNSYNEEKTSMHKVEVKGIECEFTDCRLDRSSVPEGKFMYEVGADDDCGDTPARVKRAILVNFFGTLICNEELPLDEEGVLWIDNEEEEFVFC